MNAIIDGMETPNEKIRFGCGNCSLGAVLVAASRAGIVAIFIKDTPDQLRRDLIAAFPHASLIADQAGLAETIARVVAFVETQGEELDLPLDVRGSPVERAVWRALRDVPSGQIVTYGQIARSLPLPVTAQEVGAACAANMIAVAIPCHRVVKADGSISGYRWGVQRKRKLINREAVA
jgi:AraC family transcriptional regulator of adaptative response/methylated-DNA-[protein]-cysteine methyltransferase